MRIVKRHVLEHAASAFPLDVDVPGSVPDAKHAAGLIKNVARLREILPAGKKLSVAGDGCGNKIEP